MNYELDFTSVLEDAKTLFKKNWLRLSLWCFAMTVLVGFLQQITSFFVLYGVSTPEEVQLQTLLWSLVISIPQACFMLYIFQEIIFHTKNIRHSMTVTSVCRYVLTNLFTQIIVTIAFLCCIIPGFYVAPRIMLAPIYIADNPNMSVVEAIERSWKATEGNVLTLLGFGIVSLLILIAGVICFFIGIIPAMAFTYVMMVVIYMRLSGQDLEHTASHQPEEESFVIEEKTVFRD